MSVDEVMVRVESDALLEENYTLLPYIKLEDDNMMILNSETFKDDTSTEAVLCVPIADTLFDCNIDGSFIEQQTESEDFLNEHNYNTSDENNMYWTDTPKKENVNLKCTFCHKTMKTPGGFYRHLRTHTGEKPFQCQLCDKKFSQQSNLWKHVLIHTGERRFECPHCNKKFSQRANMQKHVMVHTGERPFHCGVCSRTFTQRANLNKHIRIHTGEKPYSCKYCNRQFAQQSNMQKHEMIHEGLKPYICTICTSAFTQQSNLKKHMEIHTTSQKPKSPKSDTLYSCNACMKGYKSLDSLYKHMAACPHIENANIVIEMDENEDSDNVGEIYIDVGGTEETNEELPIMRNPQVLWRNSQTWLQDEVLNNDMFIN